MITDGSPRAYNIGLGWFKMYWKKNIIVTLCGAGNWACIAFDRKAFLGSVLVHDQHVGNGCLEGVRMQSNRCNYRKVDDFMNALCDVVLPSLSGVLLLRKEAYRLAPNYE